MASTTSNTSVTYAESKGRKTLYDTIISVKVGPSAVVFSLRKGILCQHSALFHAALSGPFKEATSQTISLPTANVDTFERFQTWVYADQILQRGETLKDLDYESIIKLYLLAESTLTPRLQNAALDTIIDKAALHQTQPSIACSGLIYENTKSTSLLRKLFVDMATRSRLRDWESFNAEASELYHNAFLVDLALALDEERSSCGSHGFSKHLSELRCSYHVHAEGEPKCHWGGKTVRFDVGEEKGEGEKARGDVFRNRLGNVNVFNEVML
ncbi:BTB/POZ-like [Lasallia pustulata]|uniref:BTB/POZ-like n=1 Tax=Lasallia pustulata TaxID=136370 RepID=A0A1W5DCJ5_9LECA|nr:BTB/POZ-like [Lasallia pustulata]